MLERHENWSEFALIFGDIEAAFATLEAGTKKGNKIGKLLFWADDRWNRRASERLPVSWDPVRSSS